jgi:hypothetical protein
VDGSVGTSFGLGGTGGGGNGAVGYTRAATNGTANLGGGGGGGSSTSGAGGSGVVILKVTGGVIVSFSSGVTQSKTSSGGFDIYTITATSTTSETVTFN